MIGSALSSILQKLEGSTIDGGFSRRSLGRALASDMSDPIMDGEVFARVHLPLHKGRSYVWDMVDPAS